MAGRNKVNKTKSGSGRRNRQARRAGEKQGPQGTKKAELLAEATRRVQARQATAPSQSAKATPAPTKPTPPAKPVMRTVDPKRPSQNVIPSPDAEAAASDSGRSASKASASASRGSVKGSKPPTPTPKPAAPRGPRKESPFDRNVALEPAALPAGPSAWHCPVSHGVWINSRDYQEWLQTRDPKEADEFPLGDPPDLDQLKQNDSRAGKRCPEDGGFLILHRVGHGIPFNLDRCGSCGGVWLDKGEWRALLAKKLHADLTRIFTSAWQAKIRHEDQQRARDATLHKRLGDADFAHASEFASWLKAHPSRAEIFAWLQERLESKA